MNRGGFIGQIRGAQMILTMKAISLGFDMDRAHQEKREKEKASEAKGARKYDV